MPWQQFAALPFRWHLVAEQPSAHPRYAKRPILSHLVLDERFQHGNFMRGSGDALCHKNRPYWGRTLDQETEALTCLRCQVIAHNILEAKRPIPTSAEREELGHSSYFFLQDY